LRLNALEILHRRHYAGQSARLATLNQARTNDSVARQLVALHTEANLTQRELAALIGTTASVICRLEDADYEGHSLTMLSRIAAALQQRVEISFVPLAGKLFKRHLSELKKEGII
jgi:transcriptional regulator with XRE-family HTH domain